MTARVLNKTYGDAARAILKLVILSCAIAGTARAQASKDPELLDLQARLYLGSDPDVGSLLRQEPAQRWLFGFPLEPVSQFRERSTSYASFEQSLVSYLWQRPASLLAKEALPATAPTILFAIDTVEGEREILSNPHDPAAWAGLMSTWIDAWGSLSMNGRAHLSLSLVAGGLDHAEKVGSMLRARTLQNRALSQVRLPTGVRRQSRSTLTERIGKRHGSFRIEGQRLRAQGGWQLEHRDGVRSLAYARYDFDDFFLPNGALISTVGNAPLSIPVEATEGAGSNANPLDFVLNEVGRGSNWIGRNRSGGEISYTLDEYGQFPLGNTKTAPTNVYDALARLHDIEYWVSTHFPEGVEVRVPAPDGEFEYFTSEGSPTRANLRVAAKVAATLTPVGVLELIDGRHYEGRRSPLTDSPVDYTDRKAMKPAVPSTAQIPAPGGVARQITMKFTSNEIRIERRSHESYRIRFNGAAVSKAVEEWESTGRWEPLKWYRRFEGQDDPSVGSPKRLPPPDSGPPPDTPGSLPGGVDLEPKLVVALDRSGGVAEIGARAAAAAEGATGPVEIVVDGERYVVARAEPRPAARPGPERAHLPVGRFVFHQTDLVAGDPTVAPVMLRRFHDSSTTGGSVRWCWSPFALEFPGSAGAKPNGAPTVVLLDRQAGVQFEYRRSDGADDHHSVDYRLVSNDDAPELEYRKGEGYLASFAHNFRAGFDTEGRLRWSGRSDLPADLVHYEWAAGAPFEIVRGEARIHVKVDDRGRPIEASSSGGDRVTYRYNSSGQLQQVEGPIEGALAFGYDEAGRLQSIRDAGNVDALVLRNAYTDDSRMVSHESPEGSWRFAYDAFGTTGHRVLVTDSEGEATRYFYDRSDQLVAYGPDDDHLTLIRRDPTGRNIVQLARARLVVPSSDEPPRFRVMQSMLPIEAPRAP